MLIELTGTDSETDAEMGPIFVDATSIRYIGYGGGDRNHRTVLRGKDLFVLVAEPPCQVKARIDVALATEAAPVAEEE